MGYAINLEEWKRKKRLEREDAKEAWILAERAAYDRYSTTARDYLREKLGDRFVDHELRAEQRAISRASADEARRRAGDKELIAALRTLPPGHELYGRHTIIKCMIAIISLTHSSATLYASAASLARLAGVSERTAFTTRKYLEDNRILLRERSGGRNAKGDLITNKYRVRWNAWREAFGVTVFADCRYEYADGTVCYLPVARKLQGNIYFNSAGYTRYSERGVLARRRARAAALATAGSCALQLGDKPPISPVGSASEPQVRGKVCRLTDLTYLNNKVGVSTCGKIRAAEVARALDEQRLADLQDARTLLAKLKQKQSVLEILFEMSDKDRRSICSTVLSSISNLTDLDSQLAGSIIISAIQHHTLYQQYLEGKERQRE